MNFSFFHEVFTFENTAMNMRFYCFLVTTSLKLHDQDLLNNFNTFKMLYCTFLVLK